MASVSYIGLNVGGTIYQTSRTTLASHPDSFFTSLLCMPSARDEQGNYRIDRDGQIFRYVLNYLRDHKLILPDGFQELALLEQEADFFQLTSLKADIQALRQASLGSHGDRVVSLDVGGKIYKTTTDILSREPDSIFSEILTNPSQPTADRKYFIPGNGDMFGYILNFLRFGYLMFSLPSEFTDTSLNALEAEAVYLQLKLLVAHVVVLRAIRRSCIGRSTGVAMFMRETQFVFYSHDLGILPDLSVFGKVKMDKEAIKKAWIDVYVLELTFDPSKVGKVVQIRNRDVIFPSSVQELVVCMIQTVGPVVVQRWYHTTYFCAFGWRGMALTTQILGHISNS